MHMQINIGNVLDFARTLNDMTLDSLITVLRSQRMERYERRINSPGRTALEPSGHGPNRSTP